MNAISAGDYSVLRTYVVHYDFNEWQIIYLFKGVSSRHFSRKQSVWRLDAIEPTYIAFYGCVIFPRPRRRRHDFPEESLS